MAKTPAERTRATRDRKRRKLILLENVEVEPALLALALVDAGYLERDTADREQIGVGLSKALHVLARSTRQGFPRHNPNTCGDLDCPVCNDVTGG